MMKNGVQKGYGKSEVGKNKHEHEPFLAVETRGTNFL